MDFEWDAEKAAANVIKYGVVFTDAQTVFSDPFYLDFYDPDHSEDEERFLAVGKATSGRILIVSYTERSGKKRLISARETTRREKRDYEEGSRH